MRKLILLLASLLVLGLSACGGGASPAGSAGDAAEGEKVFASVAAPACGSCHSLEAGVSLVGPSMSGIGAQAGSRVSGMSAADYLSQAVTEPDAHLVEGYAPGVMPATYGTQLSDQQLQDLVAYLQTLK
jgi:mono/diheme cytochrome c family protein